QAERATSTRPADDVSVSGGGGVGGGGGAQGRPVAMVVVSHGEVRVLPVVDVTKLTLAALTTVGFAGLWALQALARTRGYRRQAFSANGFARAMRRARR